MASSPGFTSYKVDNDKAFRNALDRAKGLTSDLTIPLKDIARDFYRSEKAIFQLSGPGQYPDLSETYKERKRKEVGFVYPILKRSGALADSVLSGSDSNAVYQILAKNTLILGTSLEYGAFHQSDSPRFKIPLRKFLFIGPEAPQFANSDQQGRLERWLNILNSFILAKMGVVGKVAGASKKG